MLEGRAPEGAVSVATTLAVGRTLAEGLAPPEVGCESQPPARRARAATKVERRGDMSVVQAQRKASIESSASLSDADGLRPIARTSAALRMRAAVT